MRGWILRFRSRDRRLPSLVWHGISLWASERQIYVGTGSPAGEVRCTGTVHCVIGNDAARPAKPNPTLRYIVVRRVENMESIVIELGLTAATSSREVCTIRRLRAVHDDAAGVYLIVPEYKTRAVVAIESGQQLVERVILKIDVNRSISVRRSEGGRIVPCVRIVRMYSHDIGVVRTPVVWVAAGRWRPVKRVMVNHSAVRKERDYKV